MKEYLIHFSVGPVQSFIDQARKTHDMFAGSALITDLRQQAMQFLIKKPHIAIEYITPYFDQLLDSDDIRIKQHLNKLECLIRTDCSIVELGKNMKCICEKYFIEKAVEYFKEEFDKHKSQISNFIEFTFVANEIYNNYNTAYSLQQDALNAIKQTRPFEQFDEGEVGKKCAVDKTLNVQVYRLKEGEDRKDVAQKKLFRNIEEITWIENNEKIWEISPGEGLSAVTFIKRKFLNAPHVYPSTAKLASYNFFENQKIKENLNYIIFNTIISQLDHSNDQLFFKENLTVEYFNKHNLFKTIERECIVKELSKWYDEIKNYANLNELHNNKYFGVIKFDGDNSNKWLSGKWLNITVDLKEFHKIYSKAQFNLVTNLLKTIKPPVGKIVYSGEDFLIFFNIENLVEVFDKIYNAYKICVVNVLEDKILDKYKQKLSFSAGISIAHYKEPLELVMEHTRAMLAQAKQNKNSFALQFLTGSGSASKIVLPWSEIATEKRCKAIKEVFSALKKGELSPSFINNVEYKALYSIGGILPKRFDNILKRATERACNIKGDTACVVKRTNEITTAVRELADMFPSQMDKVIDFFNLIEIIYRKSNEQFK